MNGDGGCRKKGNRYAVANRIFVSVIWSLVLAASIGSDSSASTALDSTKMVGLRPRNGANELLQPPGSMLPADEGVRGIRLS